jgi:RND family efflux transporter MFP subunit
MIKRILYRAGAILTAIWQSIRALFTRLGWLKGSALVVVLLLVVGFGYSYLRGSSATQAAPDNAAKGVEVASISDLSQGGSALSVVGTVQSQTEATVRAESSGQVTAIYHALGDSVAAGTVIAELENAGQRAAVLQAQGAVQAATAGAQVSQTTLIAAQSGAVNALLGAYSSTDKLIHGDIDAMFSNPESISRNFTVQSSNSQAKIDTEAKRGTMSTILAREQAKSGTLSTSDDLSAELTRTETELRSVRDFLDSVILTLNGGIATNGTTQTVISGYLTTANAARSSVIGSLSSIVSARQALQTATQNSADGSGQASASQASLTQAQGALAGARANLEKTIIRAPISGTINSLSLKRGDFVQMTAPVLTVANNHALEVIAYITPNDAPRIAVGDKATLDGGVTGIITKIAPAIDPLTKKIEVRVGITGNSSLINGQSVSITFAAPPRPAKTPVTRITIPLTALKIGASDMSVFTVSASSTLEAHPVTIGELLGGRVVITDGVTPDMIIVTDARGLRAGETVTVR